jgi:hypothetical protein
MVKCGRSIHELILLGRKNQRDGCQRTVFQWSSITGVNGVLLDARPLQPDLPEQIVSGRSEVPYRSSSGELDDEVIDENNDV